MKLEKLLLQTPLSCNYPTEIMHKMFLSRISNNSVSLQSHCSLIASVSNFHYSANQITNIYSTFVHASSVPTKMHEGTFNVVHPVCH